MSASSAPETDLPRLTSIAPALIVALGVSTHAFADEKTDISLPHIEPVTVTYSAFDPSHVLVNENVMVQSIARALTGGTRFPIRSTPDTKDSTDETGCRTTVDLSKHTYTIEYEALSRFSSGSATGTVRVFTQPLAVAVVKLGPPNVRSSSRSERSGYQDERYLEFSTPFRSRKPLVTTSRLATTA